MKRKLYRSKPSRRKRPLVPDELEPFMNTAEVAAGLSKTVRTVERWRKRGWLPYHKLGRGIVYKWSEIEAYFKEHFYHPALW